MDNTFQSPFTTISIGPGIRGIERGIERVVKLREIAFVEIEAFIIENLVAQMESGLLAPALIWPDAKTFQAHFFRGKVNLLLAGYPCQPFSNAGQRRGTEDPRHLYPYIEKTINSIRPDICFFENVRGHVTLGLREVIESLESLGYRVHWGIFSAEETGASHKRERVFIMAIRKDCLANSESNNGGLQLFKRQSQQTILESLRTSELGNTTESRLSIARQGGFEQSSESMANTDNRRGEQNTQYCKLWAEGSIKPSINSWDAKKRENEKISFRRVSRPGQPQQAWESPRTISRKAESDLGLSAHGYHFREDVLRALGNSVYADTAELAWRTLMAKFTSPQSPEQR